MTCIDRWDTDGRTLGPIIQNVIQLGSVRDVARSVKSHTSDVPPRQESVHDGLQPHDVAEGPSDHSRLRQQSVVTDA